MSNHDQLSTSNTGRIRQLNDQFRTTFKGGRVLVTPGVSERCDVNAVISAVQAFSDFSEANDPWGEHDFGAIEIGGQTVFWKIDYYDLELNQGSPDPTDSAVTSRVLTVLLAEEY
jgi:hypothetical protein